MLHMRFISVVPLSTYLLRAANLSGGVLPHCLFTVVEPPIFGSEWARRFEAQLVFAILADGSIALKDKNPTPYRELASKSSIINKLVESSDHEVRRQISHYIHHVLAAFASAGCVLGDLCGPGQLQGLKDFNHILSDGVGFKMLGKQSESLACLTADEDIISLLFFVWMIYLSRSLPRPSSSWKAKSAQPNTYIYFRSTLPYSHFRILKAFKKIRLVSLSDELLFWEEGKIPPLPSMRNDETVQSLAEDPSMNLQSIVDVSKPIELDESHHCVAYLAFVDRRWSRRLADLRAKQKALCIPPFPTPIPPPLHAI